jgi:hypothetical protein
MAVVKKLPMDDVLREFRIRALTTPPAAIEMTKLDKKMSHILSRTDLSKEAKIRMYDQTLNEFRAIRDIVMNVEPSELKENPRENTTSSVDEVQQQLKHGEWDLTREEDQKNFLKLYKDYVGKTFLEDTKSNIYFETQKLGTKDDVVRTLNYLLNADEEFYKHHSPDEYLKRVDPDLITSLADVAKDVLADLGISRAQWTTLFPRVARRVSLASRGDLGLPGLLKPSDISAPGSSASLDEDSIDKAAKPRLRRKNLHEVSPIPISPGSASAPVARNTRNQVKVKKNMEASSLVPKTSPASAKKSIQSATKKTVNAATRRMTLAQASGKVRSPIGKLKSSQVGTGYQIDFDEWEHHLKRGRRSV